ncbi:hypothetical protein [Avibacterium volantium]|uniref:hypothetical protein n=1 Tax=Avibacterium TaxID=292486 RepID=UPI003BF85653
MSLISDILSLTGQKIVGYCSEKSRNTQFKPFAVNNDKPWSEKWGSWLQQEKQ